jgi:hypothetical protein
MVAAGGAVSLRWNGQIDDLPSGYNDCLARGLQTDDAGDHCDSLAMLAAPVRRDRRGHGLAGRLLTAFVPGKTVGWPRVICPVRLSAAVGAPPDQVNPPWAG